MSFQDKVVLVTGASSGIGAATAIKFSEEGARVSLVGRNKEKLDKVAQKCENPLVLLADITNDEDAKRIVHETVKHFGQLDVLVNNAGMAAWVSITKENAMTVFDQVMATNLRAPVLITNTAVPYLVKTKGNIVNISSIMALQVLFKRSFCYNTSKAALDHFTRSIAMELAPEGVRVNVVNPGPVRTDILENLGATAAEAELEFEAWKNTTALNRVSTSEEVADVILFLASNKAIGITGSSLVCDNGLAISGAKTLMSDP